MRTVLAMVAVCAAASAARAQGPCRVVIVRAPDAVRTELDRWIGAEPQCARGLELRVIETPDGLYLFARDDLGFTRERTVPDARTAGALVASWIADDSVDGVWVQPPVVTAPAPMPALAAPVPVAYVDRGARLRAIGRGGWLAGAGLMAAAFYEAHRASEISAQITQQLPGTPWSSDIAEQEARGEQAEQRARIFAATAAGVGIGSTIAWLVGRSRMHERVEIVPAAGGFGVSARF